MKTKKMRNVHTGEVVEIPLYALFEGNWELEHKFLWIKVFANAALTDPSVDQEDYLARIVKIANS